MVVLKGMALFGCFAVGMTLVGCGTVLIEQGWEWLKHQITDFPLG
ncbi:MAG: hypothetical protein PHE50_00055 [Dehalococcoidales bacterium]|nr:hypothetical protein [Dehalococcoidales bacterium]